MIKAKWFLFMNWAKPPPMGSEESTNPSVCCIVRRTIPNAALAIAMKIIALTRIVSRNESCVNLTAITPAAVRANTRIANIQLSNGSALNA